MINRSDFPKKFVWGAATSSFQIEGATTTDGRGLSIWDTFAATPGKTRNGDTGEPGCDHYNRYKGDLDLMKELNLEAYRFSTAWSRVLPTGRGQVNEKGMGFYERLVDGLLERDITPWLTLYHWDLPQALEDTGGWASRDTVHAFEEYTHLMSERLGDRVKHWITHNEPWCTAYLGYQIGYFAPGIKNPKTALQVSHHLLLSHGLSVPIIRENAKAAQVGITLNLSPVHAASEASEDQAAAKRLDGLSNRWYLDPLYGRGYPQDILDLHDESAPDVATGDLAKIAIPTDFIGVNYYMCNLVKHNPAAENGLEYVKSDLDRTDFDWEIYPEGLTELAVRLGTDYQAKEVYITENGSCYDDAMIDGQVNDEKRRKYLELHLQASSEAVKQGAPLMGYFAWSLMDNFEWAEGYSRRFGLVHVDFETQLRTIKSSGKFYQQFLKGGVLD
jgi:beta-glucosidase